MCPWAIPSRIHVVFRSTNAAPSSGVPDRDSTPHTRILSAGGYYTMDMEMAAWASKTYFDFDTVIPCHYRTFPALEQSAAKLAEGLPGVQVIEPEVLTAISL